MSLILLPSLFRASRSLHALADAGVVIRVRPPHQCHVAARDLFTQQRLLPKHAAHGRIRVRRISQRNDPHAVHAIRIVLGAAEREPAATPPATAASATATTATGAILLEPVPDVIVQRDSLECPKRI